MRALFGGERPDVTALGGIASGKDRLDLFRAAVKAFAPRLVEMGYVMPAEGEPAPLLARLRETETEAGHRPGEGYDRPLAIAMEALLTLAAKAPGADEPSVHNLLASMLGLEREHWPKLVPLRDETGALIAGRVVDLERATGQITAVQGIEGRRAAEALLMSDRYYEGQRQSRASVREVADNACRLYGRDELIAQLEPDLIGEHHVGLVGDVELLDGCLAWIATEFDESKRATRYRDFVTVLQRSSRPEHGIAGVARASALLDHLLLAHGEVLVGPMIAVMLDTPGALLSRLEALVDRLPGPTLAAVNLALPIKHVAWMELSLHVAERYAALARNWKRAAESEKLSGAQRDASLMLAGAGLRTLGIRLSNLGRREEAFAASKEAVDCYRALANDRPDDFLADLALSLNNFGVVLSSLGRREEALAVCKEAVDIRRALAKDRSDAFPSLAMSLNNLGNHLSDLGRREEALAVCKEAVDIRRALAKDRPDAFLPDLAGNLNNFGAMLSNLGRGEEALAASKETVDIYRGLAKDRPDAFLPDLAGSLSNLGNHLSNLGRREEALAACKEAVDIGRALAKDRPVAFLPDLASSLNNLGNHLSDLGRREEALAVCKEAVDIRRALAKDRPDAFLPDLAMSLNNLGGDLSSLGWHEDALTAAKEAVAIYRALAKDRPDAFLPNLAISLNGLGNRLHNLGCREEALAASKEAVAIRRALANDRPDAFLPDLAGSLSNLGRDLSNLYRTLAKVRPDAFLHHLAGSLNNLGSRLSEFGHGREALAASKEGVDIYRALAKDRPGPFLPGLARSLGAMSQTLAAAGRQGEAADCAWEGLDALAPLVEAEPQAFHDLARALGRDHIEACKKAGRDPDGALLERVARCLGDVAGRDASQRSDPVLAALKARIGAITAEAERTGALDEGALWRATIRMRLQRQSG